MVKCYGSNGKLTQYLKIELQNNWNKNWQTERRYRQIQNYIWRCQEFPSVINRTNRQKISKVVEDLNNTINQGHLADIYRALHLLTTEYPFFQVHMEHSQRQTISWALTHTLQIQKNCNYTKYILSCNGVKPEIKES